MSKNSRCTMKEYCFLVMTLSVLLAPSAWSAEEHIQFDPPSIVLAPSVEDQSALYTVHVRNISDQPIRIDNVRGSCHCMGQTMGATELAPQESTDLLVTYRFENAFGMQKRSVTVLTHIVGQSEIITHTLPVQGELPSALQVQRRSLIWLGNVADEKNAIITIREGYDVMSMEVIDTPPAHEIDVTGHFDAEQRRFTIRVQPEAVWFASSLASGKLNPYTVKLRYTLRSGVVKTEPFFLVFHPILGKRIPSGSDD